MFALTPTMRVFLAAGATDMRKSFNSLAAIVTGKLSGDPVSGHLFVFCNRHRTRLKILYWDGSGLWVCAKRLEKGTFAWPASSAPQVEMSREELVLLVSGLDLSSSRRRPWYRSDADQSYAQRAY